ncbi:MAG: helix-turn-helix domain-containing protein [Bacteroidetes bacterium]|nr:MAG: helix-turn-helix domain-containing protein [Bacteroidota bacterium]
MSLHIGKLILKHLESQGINKSEFARRIGVTPQNVYSIFRRSSISTDLLQKVTQALGFNFFQYYSPEAEYHNTVSEPLASVSELERETATLKREAELLRQENEYLKMINELLKERSMGRPEPPVDDLHEAKMKKQKTAVKQQRKKKKK